MKRVAKRCKVTTATCLHVSLDSLVITDMEPRN
jgi:hypothetical protein